MSTASNAGVCLAERCDRSACDARRLDQYVARSLLARRPDLVVDNVRLIFVRSQHRHLCADAIERQEAQDDSCNSAPS